MASVWDNLEEVKLEDYKLDNAKINTANTSVWDGLEEVKLDDSVEMQQTYSSENPILRGGIKFAKSIPTSVKTLGKSALNSMQDLTDYAKTQASNGLNNGVEHLQDIYNNIQTYAQQNAQNLANGKTATDINNAVDYVYNSVQNNRTVNEMNEVLGYTNDLLHKNKITNRILQANPRDLLPSHVLRPANDFMAGAGQVIGNVLPRALSNSDYNYDSFDDFLYDVKRNYQYGKDMARRERQQEGLNPTKFVDMTEDLAILHKLMPNQLPQLAKTIGLGYTYGALESLKEKGINPNLFNDSAKTASDFLLFDRVLHGLGTGAKKVAPYLNPKNYDTVIESVGKEKGLGLSRRTVHEPKARYRFKGNERFDEALEKARGQYLGIADKSMKDGKYQVVPLSNSTGWTAELENIAPMTASKQLRYKQEQSKPQAKEEQKLLTVNNDISNIAPKTAKKQARKRDIDKFPRVEKDVKERNTNDLEHIGEPVSASVESFENKSIKHSLTGEEYNEVVNQQLPSIKYYENPKNDVVLPPLNDNHLAKIGKQNKPVVLKKNIVLKNKTNHPELDINDYNEVLQKGLYHPSTMLKTKKVIIIGILY